MVSLEGGGCKKDQVFNPATGRCVLKNGVLGRKIRAQYDAPRSFEEIKAMRKMAKDPFGDKKHGHRKSPMKESPKKSPKKERGCTQQFTKKYMTRPSPPYPANECKGYIKVGNDGQFWKSSLQRKSPTVGDVYTWKLM
jgi:hypothetical protein